MNQPKPLHIFKPGLRTAMSGVTLDFSEADLIASAAAYDPAVHEAPLVIGHPKHDAPAYGWVKSLAASADGLNAEPQQVDAAFAELVEAGRYKKISPSFYMPDAPNNPVPGVYYLRHVGFLGAQPPAVKGLRQAELRTVSYAEVEPGVVEFADWGMDTNATLWRRMREWLIGKFGQEAADQVVRDWDIESMRDSARNDDDVQPAAFADPSQRPKEDHNVTPEQKAQLEAENQRLKQQLADVQAREKKAAADKRHADHVAYAEGLVGKAQLAPKHKVAVVAFLDFADNGETVLEFGEGADKKPLAAAFKAFLDEQPKVVDFSESATKGRVGDGGGAGGSTGTADFSERDSDPERLALHRRAEALMSSKGISYHEAVQQVMRG